MNTLDYQVLTDCPVGRACLSNELVHPRLADKWRAQFGLTNGEDLREIFDETVLDGFRRRLIAELNPHYRDRPERQLQLIGSPGEPFSDLTMMTEDGYSPVGDAVVTEVVLRDGVPQYGLACPQGGPLLLAVVRTRPRTAQDKW